MPCASAQRTYMRASIAAQSQLSVPPAPALTSRKVSLPSASPSSSASVSRCAAWSRSAADRRLGVGDHRRVALGLAELDQLLLVGELPRQRACSRRARRRASGGRASASAPAPGRSRASGSSDMALSSSSRCAAVSQPSRWRSSASDFSISSTRRSVSARIDRSSACSAGSSAAAGPGSTTRPREASGEPPGALLGRSAAQDGPGEDVAEAGRASASATAAVGERAGVAG